MAMRKKSGGDEQLEIKIHPLHHLIARYLAAVRRSKRGLPRSLNLQAPLLIIYSSEVLVRILKV